MGFLVYATALRNTAIDQTATAPPTSTAAVPTASQTQEPSTPTETPTTQSPTSETPTTQGGYQKDDYRAPSPPANPPELPIPASDAEARTWLTDNALYAQSTPEPIRCSLSKLNPQTASRAALERHLNEMTACLMKEWDDTLAEAGFVAVRPRLTVFTGSIQSACGLQEGGSAFYCPADQGIYYPTSFFEHAPPRVSGSKLALIFLMGHEFGHAVQARVGIVYARHQLASQLPKNEAFEYSRRSELQASCFSGRFIRSLAQSLDLNPADRAALEELVISGGDDQQRRDPDHGLSANAVHWLSVGMDAPGNLSVCNTWIAPSDKVR